MSIDEKELFRCVRNAITELLPHTLTSFWSVTPAAYGPTLPDLLDFFGVIGRPIPTFSETHQRVLSSDDGKQAIIIKKLTHYLRPPPSLAPSPITLQPVPYSPSI